LWWREWGQESIVRVRKRPGQVRSLVGLRVQLKFGQASAVGGSVNDSKTLATAGAGLLAVAGLAAYLPDAERL
jgi:hypothetical protein